MKPESAVTLERKWGWIVFPVHRFLFKTTRGVIGGKFDGRPMLLMTTTGAKSGQARELLIQYYPDGEDMVVVASNGGREKHPAWLHNVRKNPGVAVSLGRRKLRTTARVLPPDERDALWPTLTAWYPGYAHYQTLTERRIEVVRLHPEP
jgi:deazaflavin-dependent oxidoreductase (nitroreductase family)